MPPRPHVAVQRKKSPRKRYDKRENGNVHVDVPELPFLGCVAVDDVGHVFADYVEWRAEGYRVHKTFQRNESNARAEQYQDCAFEAGFKDVA